MHFTVQRAAFRGHKLRRGAMLPLVAILLPVLIVFLGFSVDMAFMQISRAELRTATDGAARAGAIELAQSEDADKARAAAIAMAERNTVAGEKLLLQEDDVKIGRSERDGSGQWVFEVGVTPWNSVQVVGDRRASSKGGAIDLFFSTFYGGKRFEPTVTAISTFMNIDVCLVLDRSGSMKGKKLRDLQAAVEVFLSELEDTDTDEQVALASYATTASLDVTLATDYSEIRDEVDDYEAKGNTAIGLALYKGIAGVTGNGRRNLSAPVIILMTDGNHNTKVEPIVPAREASSQGIVVHTITFGGDADVKRMKAVAEETGGRHYHANTGGELTEVFRQIAKTLPTQLTL
jgi:Ca-activated chloride channel homolog